MIFDFVSGVCHYESSYHKLLPLLIRRHVSTDLDGVLGLLTLWNPDGHGGVELHHPEGAGDVGTLARTLALFGVSLSLSLYGVDCGCLNWGILYVKMEAF